MKKKYEFSTFNLNLRNVEGGAILSAMLSTTGGEGEPGQVSASREVIVTGKHGTPVMNARIRKAVKGIVEAAFPRPDKAAVESFDPNQTMLPGISR